MQTKILRLSNGDVEGEEMLGTVLSFEPFIKYLKERITHEDTMKKNFFEFVLNKFTSNKDITDELKIEQMHLFKEELEMIYSLLVPPIANEKKTFWALSMPVKPAFFYGTDALYDFMLAESDYSINGPEQEIDCSFKKPKPKDDSKLKHLYSFILERLFHISLSHKDEMVFSIVDEKTKLSRYFNANIDKRFVDVIANAPLPQLDLNNLANKLEGNDFEWKHLLEILPLSMFTFKGFAIITIDDITARQAVENIKALILDRLSYSRKDLYQNVIHSLQSLFEDESTEFGMLPVIRINNRLVITEEGSHYSLVSEAMGKEIDPSNFTALVERYLKNPRVLLYDLTTTDRHDNLVDYLKEIGVVAYALIPISYNNHIAGVLEVYSKKKNILSADSLSKLEPAIPLLAQLMQNVIEEFESSIETTIKEKFTALQPSVQWKFNEVAWQHINDKQLGKTGNTTESIVFKNVYPLYGAIDIRNSTIERNAALAADYKVLFGLLEKILQEIKKQVGIPLADEMIFKCSKWLDIINESFSDDDHVRMNDFLELDIVPFLTHFRQSNPELGETIRQYFDAVDEATGLAFNNRRILETSMQTVNNAVNQYLEFFRDEIQRTYPCYFEKFRTDGVEYDIYIGQSIVPDKMFSQVYLKNIRLWQLRSMAAIAKMVHSLLPQLEKPLQTTQLIFIRSATIDIAFRVDERKFDVEGAYNIRYQIIKKRIDKVHIKNSAERLTQPGKIALVYFNKREADEYAEYISYLQNEGVLNNDLEYLDLEELQGVSGLRAMRVGVAF